jgi:hypothetical protein
VRKSKEARKTEQARGLALEAEKIAQILNEDFRKISDRLRLELLPHARDRRKPNLVPKQPTKAPTIGCEGLNHLILF